MRIYRTATQDTQKAEAKENAQKKKLQKA